MESLYQQQILDYAKESRISTVIDQPTHGASYNNPICGDRVDVTLAVINGNVDKMGVTVRGCALCEAGAGLALKCLPGHDVIKIRQLSEGFAKWIEGEETLPPLKNMEHFTPVRSIRNRHKCVLLAFHATLKALASG